MENNSRNHCYKIDECWQYIYMVGKNFNTEDIYEVCRKCIFFKWDKDDKRK